MAYTFRKYPFIERIECPADTPNDGLVRLHREKIGERFAANPPVYPVCAHSLEDAFQAYERMREYQWMHQKASVLIDPDQIARVASKHQEKAAALLAEAVEKAEKEGENAK